MGLYSVRTTSRSPSVQSERIAQQLENVINAAAVLEQTLDCDNFSGAANYFLDVQERIVDFATDEMGMDIEVGSFLSNAGAQDAHRPICS